ncbi:hypothetical protein [Brucella intermedia]|uniref:hypothetical protein n=1 Tax=Brucella intermedia TaxID=94625 RepID=UPI00236104BA|nr:hypothetical protein [Brucella intermedia]
MAEDERYKERLNYIIGRIDTLEQVLRITIATLTDTQRQFVVKAAEEYAQRRQESALAEDTDPARDKATAAWDTAENIKRAMGDWAEHFDTDFRR